MEQTHCYPFSTQVRGDCLAQRLQQTGERRITTKTVKAVEVAVIDERDAMYRVRRNEIDDEGLLSIAESIAEAFIQGGALRLYERDLKEAIAQGMAGDGPITDQSIREKLKQLSHLGYVWQSKEGGYEPAFRVCCPTSVDRPNCRARLVRLSLIKSKSGTSTQNHKMPTSKYDGCRLARDIEGQPATKATLIIGLLKTQSLWFLIMPSA